MQLSIRPQSVHDALRADRTAEFVDFTLQVTATLAMVPALMAAVMSALLLTLPPTGLIP